MGETIGLLFNTLLFEPILNGLILLYGVLFHNLALTIVVFTILVRVLILPLTLRQLHAAKGLSRLQPEMAKLQKKYKDDRQRLSQEQMRLYREQGVNPLGCAVPTLIQFPVWIGLYQAILLALAATPESLLNLSRHLYPGLKDLHALVPLQSKFLWMDLGLPDASLILPLLVGSSMWLQQKMMTMPTEDSRQQQMNSTMQWMMPVMFGFFTTQFSSGLAIYWFVSNLISIVVQYFVTGWGSLTWFNKALPAPVTSGFGAKESQEEAGTEIESGATKAKSKKGQSNGKSGNKRKIGRRSR